MPSIHIDAGSQTEALLQFITHELDDATLDQVEVNRNVAKSDHLATEPLTASVLLVLAPTAIVLVARIIERWMENQRQKTQIAIVANGFTQSESAGQALAELSKAYTKVSVSYGMPKTAPKR